MNDNYSKRMSAIHLLRSGTPVEQVAEELGKSRSWVYKWRARFQAANDWLDLQDHSRAPQHCPGRLSGATRQAVCRIRSQLEAEAGQQEKLVYVGSQIIQSRLEQEGYQPLPSLASIERILSAQGMTKPRHSPSQQEDHYPHLHPHQPLDLIQVDIVPNFLQGIRWIACYNAVDVVSHYPTGEQFFQKSSLHSAQFLIRVWQQLGLPKYIQMDNEGCFSGGFTHPRVLGKVLRLCLYVGIELVFSPLRHPQSNGWVERFHQDYNNNTWKKTTFTGLLDIQLTSQHFFDRYRHSQHIEELEGRCPEEVHFAQPVFRLPENFALPDPIPLTTGRVHFMRKVSPQQTIELLNSDWDASSAEAGQCVWVTLEFAPKGARLRIYDQAPDANEHHCLEERDFPLQEAVLPLRPEFQRPVELNHSLLHLATSLFRTTVMKLVLG